MSLHTAAQATKNRFLVGLAKEEAHPFEKSERVVKKNILDGKFKRSNAESGQFAIFGTTSPFWKRKNTNETRTSFMKPVLPFRGKKNIQMKPLQLQIQVEHEATLAHGIWSVWSLWS